jgi:hypothetical protein
VLITLAYTNAYLLNLVADIATSGISRIAGGIVIAAAAAVVATT